VATVTQGTLRTATIDIHLLRRQAQYYYSNGLARTTQSTYSLGQQRFQSFCHAIQASSSPASEVTLILFAVHLASEKISYVVYLAAVRNTHVAAELHSHFQQQLTPRLHVTLKGIKKRQATTQPARTRLLNMLDIMSSIKKLLSSQPNSYLYIMIWEACCLAFFGFLRVSEFTVPGDNQFDESCHLSLNSVAIDNRDKPT